MQKDILFDNIYIGHSIDDAAALRKETWDIKRAAEDVEDAASQPKAEDKPKSPMDLVFKDDPIKYVKERLDLFISIAKKDPLEAIRFLPEVAGGIGVAVVTLLALLIGIIGLGTSSSAAAPSKDDLKKAADKAKEKVVEAKDQAVDAASSGVDTAKAEISKRTTRSSGVAE
jgi:calnexin